MARGRGRSSNVSEKGKKKGDTGKKKDIEDSMVDACDNSDNEESKEGNTSVEADEGLPKAPSSTQTVRKVLIVPKEIRNTVGWGNMQEIQLKHPRTGKNAAFLVVVNKETQTKSGTVRLYEILTMRQETRSWFLNDSVISDGSAYVCTAVDPLFLMLPILAKSGMAKPISDHLYESSLPRHVAVMLGEHLSSEQLENIALKKGSDDIVAFAYSESKTLTWLKAKSEKVSKFLLDKEISHVETSISSNFTSSISREDCLRYACDIIGEYIDDNLKTKLLQKLNLPIVSVKRKSEAELNGTPAKKSKTGDGAPLEDYGSADYSPAVNKNVKVTAKEKGLQKAAQGSHSLFKFFAPKSK